MLAALRVGREPNAADPGGTLFAYTGTSANRVEGSGSVRLRDGVWTDVMK